MFRTRPGWARPSQGPAGVVIMPFFQTRTVINISHSLSMHMPVGLSPEMSFVGTCCYRTEAILATMVAVHAVFVRLEHVPGIVWAGTVPVIVKVVGGCTVFPP